jgi:hypothetical protein
MTRHNKFMALIVGGALTLAGTGYASQAAQSPAAAPAAKQTAKASSKAMTSVTRGTIKSIDDKQIVVERKLKSGTKDMTFAMNSNTQKQGDLKAGEQVVVHYRKDNNQEVATMVRTAKAAKPGKTAKS